MSSVLQAVGLFPKAPPMAPPPAPPPPPTIDQTQQVGQDAADALRRRRGSASTILSGLGQSQSGEGNASSTQPVTQAARLLGG